MVKTYTERVLRKIVNVSTIGANVTLLFQSKYQTFTPEQFITTFQKLGFVQTKGSANISANPAAQAVPTTMFSKQNLIVLYNPNENLIIFQIINTLDFNPLYEDKILKILASLNFNPTSVSLMGIDATTQVHDVKYPIATLSSLTKPEFIADLNTLSGDGDMVVSGIKLGTVGSEKESLSINLEPLQTDPSGSYFIAIAYRTKESDKFNEFVKDFGAKMIEDIIREAEKNV